MRQNDLRRPFRRRRVRHPADEHRRRCRRRNAGREDRHRDRRAATSSATTTSPSPPASASRRRRRRRTPPTDLMVQADLALYRAKDDGRNRYRFHDSDLDRQVHTRVLLARELQMAIARGELELLYQPQVADRDRPHRRPRDARALEPSLARHHQAVGVHSHRRARRHDPRRGRMGAGRSLPAVAAMAGPRTGAAGARRRHLRRPTEGGARTSPPTSRACLDKHGIDAAAASSWSSASRCSCMRRSAMPRRSTALRDLGFRMCHQRFRRRLFLARLSGAARRCSA